MLNERDNWTITGEGKGAIARSGNRWVGLNHYEHFAIFLDPGDSSGRPACGYAPLPVVIDVLRAMGYTVEKRDA